MPTAATEPVPKEKKLPRESRSVPKFLGKVTSFGEPLGEGCYEIDNQGRVLRKNVPAQVLRRNSPTESPSVFEKEVKYI